MEYDNKIKQVLKKLKSVDSDKELEEILNNMIELRTDFIENFDYEKSSLKEIQFYTFKMQVIDRLYSNMYERFRMYELRETKKRILGNSK